MASVARRLEPKTTGALEWGDGESGRNEFSRLRTWKAKGGRYRVVRSRSNYSGMPDVYTAIVTTEAGDEIFWEKEHREGASHARLLERAKALCEEHARLGETGFRRRQLERREAKKLRNRRARVKRAAKAAKAGAA